MPDLGEHIRRLWRQKALASAGAPEAISKAFDTTLVQGAAPFIASLSTRATFDSIDISVVDTYSLLDAIVAHPAAFGFTNVTQPCLTGEVNYSGGTPCATPSQYLFWDQLHPTAAADLLVADRALGLVTPEPAPISLLALGLSGIVFVRRRYLGSFDGFAESRSCSPGGWPFGNCPTDVKILGLGHAAVGHTEPSGRRDCAAPAGALLPSGKGGSSE